MLGDGYQRHLVLSTAFRRRRDTVWAFLGGPQTKLFHSVRSIVPLRWQAFRGVVLSLFSTAPCFLRLNRGFSYDDTVCEPGPRMSENFLTVKADDVVSILLRLIAMVLPQYHQRTLHIGTSYPLITPIM